MKAKSSDHANLPKIRLLNVDVINISFSDFLQSLSGGTVVTPNVDHLIKLQKDSEFYRCYNQAEHIVCDSRILQWFSWVLFPGSGIREIIPGSDLLPAYCNFHAKNGGKRKVFLLGGNSTSVQTAKLNLNKNSKAEIVVGAYSPPFGFETDNEENKRIIEIVNLSGADTLVVGVGAPKQEKWIFSHRHLLTNVRVILAVGAAIEFAAGNLSRAPKWMNKCGLEWLYRMVHDPTRLIRRYLVDDVVIFWLMLKQKVGIYRNPWTDHD